MAVSAAGGAAVSAAAESFALVNIEAAGAAVVLVAVVDEAIEESVAWDCAFAASSDGAEDVGAVAAASAAGLEDAEGDEKKEVIVALPFVFFAVEAVRSAALRLSGAAIVVDC